MSGSGAPKQLCGKRHWRGERCPEGICPQLVIPETANTGKAKRSTSKADQTAQGEQAASVDKETREHKTGRADAPEGRVRRLLTGPDSV